MDGAGACPACGAGQLTPPRASAALLVLGLVVAGCGDKGHTGMQADYGIAVVDEDGDGYDQYDDCDDGDASVFPDAKETAGDGVDSNCDGADDT
jgi:hypothetical protein